MLSDALDRYLKEVSSSRKPESYKRELSRSKIIIKQLGQYSLAALNPQLIAKYRDDRLAEGKSNNTVRLELATLGHLFTIAIKEWGISLSHNPVFNVRKPSPGQGRNRRLVGDEEARLLAAVSEHSNPMLKNIVKIALYTAMRQGEILNITRQSVNLAKRTILLSETKNGSVRTVPLSDKAVTVLNESLNSDLRILGTDLLFPGEPNKDGERKPLTINKTWKSALKRAEIIDLKFHDLRHEATSRLVEAGLSDQEVAAITGHKSMQMLKRYTHLRGEDLADKIRNL